MTENRPIDVTRKILVKALEYDDLKIPVLPKIAQDIMMMSQDPNADIETLSSLIHEDQSIASHVLHISNSAAFGGFARVESLEQAVARLGLKLLSEIAISVSIQKNVFNIPEFQKEIKGMWKHSLASAIYGKQLAVYSRKNTDMLYLCALLHEIGKPVTLFTINNIPADAKEGLTKQHVLELVEEFHMSVGTIVTRQWDLPETIQYANLYYKDWVNAPQYREETAITYLADQLASRTLNEENNDIHHILEDPAFTTLEIPVTKLEQLLDFKEDVVAKLSSMDV